MRFWFPDARRFSDAVTASGLRMLWRGGGVKLRVNPPFQVPSAFSMTVVGPHYQRRIRMSRRTAGRYAGWWRPDPSRVPRGSYRLKPEGPGLHRTWPKKNIFYQPVETGSAAVVRSRDRRYHLEIEGRGLSFSTALSFEPVPEAPAAPEELTPLEEPRQLLPRTLESLDPMHLSVELPPAIQTPAKQVGLYRWNPVSRAWRPVSHRPGPTPHSRRTTVWSSAVVGLFRDSHPPELGEVRVNRTESALWIPVRETGSGVNARSLRAHQQQREIPVRWNKYNRRLEIPRDTLTPGDQPVRVTVHDRAGNRQSTTVSAADLP